MGVARDREIRTIIERIVKHHHNPIGYDLVAPRHDDYIAINITEGEFKRSVSCLDRAGRDSAPMLLNATTHISRNHLPNDPDYERN